MSELPAQAKHHLASSTRPAEYFSGCERRYATAQIVFSDASASLEVPNYSWLC